MDLRRSERQRQRPERYGFPMPDVDQPVAESQRFPSLEEKLRRQSQRMERELTYAEARLQDLEIRLHTHTRLSGMTRPPKLWIFPLPTRSVLFINQAISSTLSFRPWPLLLITHVHTSKTKSRMMQTSRVHADMLNASHPAPVDQSLTHTMTHEPIRQEYIRTRVCNTTHWGLARRNFK